MVGLIHLVKHLSPGTPSFFMSSQLCYLIIGWDYAALFIHVNGLGFLPFGNWGFTKIGSVVFILELANSNRIDVIISKLF